MAFKLNDVLVKRTQGLESFDFYVKIVHYRHGLGFIGLFAPDELAISCRLLEWYGFSDVVCCATDPEFDELMNRLQPEAERQITYWSLLGASIHNVTEDLIEETISGQN